MDSEFTACTNGLVVETETRWVSKELNPHTKEYRPLSASSLLSRLLDPSVPEYVFTAASKLDPTVAEFKLEESKNELDPTVPAWNPAGATEIDTDPVLEKALTAPEFVPTAVETETKEEGEEKIRKTRRTLSLPSAAEMEAINKADEEAAVAAASGLNPEAPSFDAPTGWDKLTDQQWGTSSSSTDPNQQQLQQDWTQAQAQQWGVQGGECQHWNQVPGYNYNAQHETALQFSATEEDAPLSAIKKKNAEYETEIHFHKCYSVMSELWEKFESLLPDQFAFLDLGCAPGGFSCFLLEDPRCKSGLGVSLNSKSGGFPIRLRRSNFVMQLGDLFELKEVLYKIKLQICICDAQYLRNSVSWNKSYQGTRCRSKQHGVWSLLLKQFSISFGKLAEGGILIFRFGWKDAANCISTKWYKNVSIRLFTLCTRLFDKVHFCKSEYYNILDSSFYVCCTGFKLDRYLSGDLRDPQGTPLPQDDPCLLPVVPLSQVVPHPDWDLSVKQEEELENPENESKSPKETVIADKKDSKISENPNAINVAELLQSAFSELTNSPTDDVLRHDLLSQLDCIRTVETDLEISNSLDRVDRLRLVHEQSSARRYELQQENGSQNRAIA